jgi:hypothetical protein
MASHQSTISKDFIISAGSLRAVCVCRLQQTQKSSENENKNSKPLSCNCTLGYCEKLHSANYRECSHVKDKTIFSQWGEDSSPDIRLQKHHYISTDKSSTSYSCAAQQRGGITPGPASTSRSKLTHTLVTGGFRLKSDNNLIALIMTIQKITTELSRAAQETGKIFNIKKRFLNRRY